MDIAPALPVPAPSRDDGLFRTRLAGRHARLSEAFGALRQASNAAGLYGQRLQVSTEADEGAWELLSLRDEIFMIVSDCRYAVPRSETVVPEGFVEFHFMLSGPVNVEFSDTGNIQIAAPNLTVVCQGDDMGYRVSCGPGTWRSVAIYVSQAYFQRFLDDAIGIDSAIARDLAAIGNEQLLCHQMPVNTSAVHAVEQLFVNPYEGHRRFLFAEAKAIEILCASVDLWQSFLATHGSAEIFSARDIRLIEKAKDLLLQDLTRVPTIPELARGVGTNTSKLKRGFKFLYGTTIFDFGHRHRMKRALELLVLDRLSVNEVASAVGYQHQTSFTASFRQHFGFAPKDARRMANTGSQTLGAAQDS